MVLIPRRNMGQTPRVGVEIEVVHWGFTNTTTPRNGVCTSLINEGLMANDTSVPFQKEHHTYGCHCTTCTQWIASDSDPYPVQFTLEYDGSLPSYGGEFITSPFPMVEDFYNSFLKGWNIITADAVRDLTVPSKNHPTSSPSVHVHASCFNPDNYNPIMAYDFVKAFAPEIYVLGLATGLDRGYTFRHIDYDMPVTSKDYAHHRVLNLQGLKFPKEQIYDKDLHDVYPGMKPDAQGRYHAGPHIEVRTWEAEYNEPRYLEGAVHFSAGLAQVMSSEMMVSKMLGYTMMRDLRSIRARDWNVKDGTNLVITHANPKLLEILTTAIKRTTYISYWSEAYDAVDWLYESTMQEVFG